MKKSGSIDQSIKESVLKNKETVLSHLKIARVNQLRFQCDFSAIYRRGLRCNSRNTVTLSSSFTFE